MKNQLYLASIITLGLLSGFVLAILLAGAYVIGFISWWLMIGITILFNIIVWLVNPYISDIIFRIFYKIKFYEFEQIKDQPYAKFLKKICDKYEMKVPKIGIIQDKNPTAFTYGSAAFNARVVLTEGLFHFLNEDEINSVVAHEVGHIKNKDFIIMSIAATLLQILYQIYVVFARSQMARNSASKIGKKASKGNGKGNVLVMIGMLSYVFYWIGTYIVLYLSRVREYYADEFAARESGNPNFLSSALIKIAYGIATTPDTTKTAHLLNNSRAQGIFDFKSAKEVGLIYQNSNVNKGLLEKALLFDIVSPWARLLQLKSTHPLVGKRIKRLCSLTTSPAFDFNAIINKGYDKKRLWDNFFRDIAVNYFPSFIILSIFGLLLVEYLYSPGIFIYAGIAGISLYIIASIIKIRYRFPLESFKEATVLDCMADIYASPIRGKPIKLSGKAIGRGKAGFIFGEDMIFQDNTGFIYLNYESGLPILGNLIFAWKKLEKLFEKPSISTGWFMRGATHHMELFRYESGSEKIKSYVRFWNVFGVFISAVFWIVVFALCTFFIVM